MAITVEIRVGEVGKETRTITEKRQGQSFNPRTKARVKSGKRARRLVVRTREQGPD